MLHYCVTCGRWQHTGLRQMLHSFLDRAALAAHQIPMVWDEAVMCPQGHGAMRQIAATDRILVRPPNCQVLFASQTGAEDA